MKKHFFKTVSINGVKGLFLGAAGIAMSTTPLAGGMKQNPIAETPVDDTLEPAAAPAEAEEPVEAKAAVEAEAPVQAKPAPKNYAKTTASAPVAATEDEDPMEVGDVADTEDEDPMEVGDVADTEDEEVIEQEEVLDNEEEEADIEEVEIENFELDEEIFTMPTVSAELPEDIIPYTVDEEVPSTSIDYAMSFKEALDTAREEVGEAGVFEWRGNLFATFYEENWDKMSNDEKEAFVGHIQWIDEDGIHFDFQEEPVGVKPVDKVNVVLDDPVEEYDDVALDEINEEDLEPEVELVADVPLDEIDEDDLEPEVEILGISNTEDEVEILGIDVDGDDVMLVDISEEPAAEIGIDDLLQTSMESVEPETTPDEPVVGGTDEFTLA